MNLTQEQADLLNTDFGEEIEKEAAQRAQAISECYQYGNVKLAAEVADKMDEEDKKEDDKDEDKKEDKKMDEESEKAAAELGAFIERGFFDGLRKLGSERHGDEFHYIHPYIQEKVAKKGAQAAAGFLEKGIAKAKELGGAARAKAEAAGKAVKDYHVTGGKQVSEGAKGMYAAAKNKDLKAFGEAAKTTGKGAVKFAPHAAVVGGTGAYAMSGGKKEGQ